MRRLLLVGLLCLPACGPPPCRELMDVHATVIDAVEGSVARLADGRLCRAEPGVREGKGLDGETPQRTRRRVETLRGRLEEPAPGDLEL